MKFAAVHISAIIAAVLVPSVTKAYMYGSGPGGSNCRPPRSAFNKRGSFSSSQRANDYRQRQERIEQMFQNLQKEMNVSQQRSKRSTGQFDFMMVDPFSVDFQDVDKEAVKKWVSKAFDLASEFNQDFSKTPQEVQKNNEFLQKSREWVENMYTQPESNAGRTESSIQEENSDESDLDNNRAPFSSSTSETGDNGPDASKEPEVITPYSENRSDENTFRVVVDLPGVDRLGVDLTLENDFLIVEAERRNQEQEDSEVRIKYFKKFVLTQDEIEVDKIIANLSDGVLTVTAPKKIKEEKETMIKIPLY